NIVVRDLSQNPNGTGRWNGIVVGADPQDDGKPVKLDKEVMEIDVGGGTKAYVVNRGVFFAVRSTERIDLRGNVVRGGSSEIGTIIQSPGECLLADNRWDHVGGPPAVAVTASFAIVSANRAIAGQASLVLNVDPKRSTVVGNITSTPILMQGPL